MKLLENIFGLTVFFAIVLSLLIPGVAYYLIPLNIYLLGLLMFLAALEIDFSRLKNISIYYKELFFGNIFIFLLFPLIQLFIANLFFDNQHLIYGVLFSALTPIALVAPFFTSLTKGNKELAFLLILSSMLLTPFLTPLLLNLFLSSSVAAISTWVLFWNMVLIIPIPIFISFVFIKLFPRVTSIIKNSSAILNQITLGTLIFILFGVSIEKINFGYMISWFEVFLIFLIIFIQDFLPLFFSYKFFNFKKEDLIALKISLSMKNIAIAAGILIFYNPIAALVPAIGFIAHTILFSFIPIFRDKI